MDPASSDYAVKRINASKYADPYNNIHFRVDDLHSPSQGVERNPIAIEANLTCRACLWPVHQGCILEPMLYFARTVREHPELRANPRYAAKAEAYIAAAEELLILLDKTNWRENDQGEGWYIVEKGAPVWMDGLDEPLNHGLAIGVAMVHLAAVTGNAHWHDRTEKMARMFKNDLRLDPKGDLYLWGYCWGKGLLYNGFGLGTNVSVNCLACVGEKKMEDCAHSTIEIKFAYFCYKDGIVFVQRDMERLANTYVKNVFRHKEDGTPTCADLVDGSGGVGSYDRLTTDVPLLAEFNPDILKFYEELRAQTSWNIIDAPLMAQCANMNLMRVQLNKSRGIR
jgi:hypothetical protein